MPTSPFVGRAEELRELRRELDTAVASGSRIALVTGDPGVGKTRLLAEFLRAAGRRATCLLGRGSPLDTAIPFSIVVEALQSHLRTLGAAEVSSLVGDRAHELAALLPSVAATIGPAADGPAPSRLATLEALAGLLKDMARARPLVVCLDDVHQADPSTWEFLSYLGRNPIRSPLMIAVACRTEAVTSDQPFGASIAGLLKDGLASEVRLSPLDREEMAALARCALGSERADGELASWLYDRTRGNALFAMDLLEELALDPSRRVVPISVKERVRASVTVLDPEGRTVLELASVLGHTFSLRTIAGLLPEGGGSLVDGLVAQRFLVERSEGGEVSFDFVHPLVQEAIYGNIGAARRRELHLGVARRSGGEQLAVRAYHAARGALRGTIGRCG